MKRAALAIVVLVVIVVAVRWGRSLGASPSAPRMDPRLAAAGAPASPTAATAPGENPSGEAPNEGATLERGLLELVADLLADGELEAARSAADAAVERDPNSSVAHLALSRVLRQEMTELGPLRAMMRLGTYKDELQKALELDPNNVEAHVDQIAFLIFAPGIAGGDAERGLELARALAEVRPERGLVMVVLALARNEQPDEALAECRAALKAFPDHADLHSTLAGLLVEREEWDEADEHFAIAVERGEGAPRYRALYQRGKLRVERGYELEQAIEMFTEFAAAEPRGELVPPVAGAHWRIGNALEQLGRVEEARAAYGDALRLDPDFEQASESLEALDD